MSKKSLIFENKKTGLQFLKFALIGILNTGIHYSVFLFLLRIVGVYFLAASAVGYCCGLINSYIFNKLWTFKARGTRKHLEFMKFVLVNIVALGANIISLKGFVSYLSLSPETGQVLAIAFSLIANFVGNKLWTFRFDEQSTQFQ